MSIVEELARTLGAGRYVDKPAAIVLSPQKFRQLIIACNATQKLVTAAVQPNAFWGMGVEENPRLPPDGWLLLSEKRRVLAINGRAVWGARPSLDEGIPHTWLPQNGEKDAKL